MFFKKIKTPTVPKTYVNAYAIATWDIAAVFAAWEICKASIAELAVPIQAD
ncbi:hypothetical protein HMPREF0518_1687 [Lactobacillus helveticus DSM 20075 = CGMCC 1.1877]|nr:hypothetical protein HMPREF0518_1687 [Lactobacillus helveticus DSM 20075 = CGMCC 1.1877]GFP16304.1 hypothetical protein LHEJCM1120_19330 [Lactobacillus helveticus]